MTDASIDDCFRPSQRRLTHAEAIGQLRDRVRTVVGEEAVDVGSAAGRFVAGAVSAPFPVPAHTNSAVDGYAFAAAHYVRDRATEFQLAAGRAAAGHPLDAELPPGHACRILTGAPMPQGADTVVMQEDVVLRGDTAVVVPAGLKPQANVRRAGEDIQAGSVLFETGHRLRPQDLAALASVGRDRVTCYRHLRVGIISTGDEIRRPDGVTPLGAGEVFDANAPMLAALARQTGVRVDDLGVWPDRFEVVRDRLSEAARSYDVLLTSGGASLGDEDHLSTALAGLGQRHFWQLAIKPGRPMMFGQIGACVVAGLPGNPVAVFVCYLMYVHPLLTRLAGGHWPEPRRLTLPAAFSFTGRKSGRREFWRGMLVEHDGTLAVDKFRRDGSGLISGLRAADGLIDIPEDAGDVAPGDKVAFIPFREFGLV